MELGDGPTSVQEAARAAYDRFDEPRQYALISFDEKFDGSRVAWVNEAGEPHTPALPPGIGLQFLELSEEDRAAIIAFVKGKLLSPLW